MSELPVSFYASPKKLFFNSFPSLAFATISICMITHPSAFTTVGGYFLLAFSVLLFLPVLMPALQRSPMFSVSEKGIIYSNHKETVPWSDIAEFKAVDPGGNIGVFVKDNDKYYATLSPAQKKLATQWVTRWGAPMVLSKLALKEERSKAVAWLNECKRKYS